jgi:hypothetical protein
MNVLLGRKSAAYTNLTYLLDSYILPNTFYHEGENGECGETPPAASSAIQDWMLMEDDGILHVFAGISDNDLSDASFYQLRGPGAFLVSAVRKAGVTSFISVTSEKGAPLAIMTDLTRPLATVPAGVPMKERPDGAVSIELTTGASVSVYSAAAVNGVSAPPPAFVVTASDGNSSQANSWGWPSFHGLPPPPPPPPPSPPCPAAFETLGYDCHMNKCGDDAFKVTQQCGNDLCYPTVSSAMLCGPIVGKAGTQEAIAGAAARCSNFTGGGGPHCKSFGMTPNDVWGSVPCGGKEGTSTCAKFFSNSGNDFLTPATHWVMWTKKE